MEITWRNVLTHIPVEQNKRNPSHPHHQAPTTNEPLRSQNQMRKIKQPLLNYSVVQVLGIFSSRNKSVRLAGYCYCKGNGILFRYTLDKQPPTPGYQKKLISTLLLALHKHDTELHLGCPCCPGRTTQRTRVRRRLLLLQ